MYCWKNDDRRIVGQRWDQRHNITHSFLDYCLDRFSHHTRTGNDHFSLQLGKSCIKTSQYIIFIHLYHFGKKNNNKHVTIVSFISRTLYKLIGLVYSHTTFCDQRIYLDLFYYSKKSKQKCIFKNPSKKKKSTHYPKLYDSALF